MGTPARNAGRGARAIVVLALVSAVAALLPATADAARAVDLVGAWSSADTYVDKSLPTTSFGDAPSVLADADPPRQAFLKFDVAGIAGRRVRDVRLRVYQTDGSLNGGRVFSTPADAWDESITWATRPPLQGAPLAEFGPVTVGSWYDVSLGPIISGDGVVSLGIDSPHSDGSAWGSRESDQPAELIVEVERVPGMIVDGVSQLAPRTVGSSDPTEYAGNRRLAVTAGGRQLAVYGRHSEGVQLAWRDPAGTWQTISRGAVADGLLLGGAGTGDWVASIATASDSLGAQHAWVVWGSTNSAIPRTVQMRRLSDLDGPNGPSVGPAVTIADAAELGRRPDLAFEARQGEPTRAAVTWTRTEADGSHAVVVSWLTDLDSDTPPVHDPVVLVNGTDSAVTATLEPAPDGLRLVARDAGALRMFTHRSSVLTDWTAGRLGIAVASSARPSVVALSTGVALVTSSVDAGATIVTVQRYTADAKPRGEELRLEGYREPVLTTDGTNAWLVMVRAADGAVVSRQRIAGRWSSTDGVELSPSSGGNYQWPNLANPVDGRLRLVVRGPSLNVMQTSVLAFQRAV
jgi:hypothetical protein